MFCSCQDIGDLVKENALTFTHGNWHTANIDTKDSTKPIDGKIIIIIFKFQQGL